MPRCSTYRVASSPGSSATSRRPSSPAGSCSARTRVATTRKVGPVGVTAAFMISKRGGPTSPPRDFASRTTTTVRRAGRGRSNRGWPRSGARARGISHNSGLPFLSTFIHRGPASIARVPSHLNATMTSTRPSSPHRYSRVEGAEFKPRLVLETWRRRYWSLWHTQLKLGSVSARNVSGNIADCVGGDPNPHARTRVRRRHRVRDTATRVPRRAALAQVARLPGHTRHADESMTRLRSGTPVIPSCGRSGICTDQVWSMMRIRARTAPLRLVQCTAAD